MHNELLTIGNITIYGYGLMIAIGIFAAYLTTEYRAKKKGLDSDPVFWILIFGVISGFLGSKLLYIITVLDEVIANPASLLDIADGWVVYGGIIAGILGGALCCKIRKVSFLTYLDLVVPAVALAQGFGRIGCFLAGCCYGHESHLPIAITFHDSAYAPNNVPLFPSQLLSSALNFVHFFLLCAIAKRTDKTGVIGACYLIFYSVGRFCIEFLRGDLERGNVGALSTSQFISLFVALAGVLLLVFLKKKKAQ